MLGCLLFKKLKQFNESSSCQIQDTRDALLPDFGKTWHHFKTKIEEHIKKDSKSRIFKYLHTTTTYFDLYNSLSFKMIDKANSKFDLKIKELLHINWRKPNLNAQQEYLTLTISL